MAGERLAVVSNVDTDNSFTVDELSSILGERGYFIGTAKLEKDTGYIAGIGMLSDLEVGTPEQASRAWLKKHTMPGLGPTEPEAIQKALQNLRLSQQERYLKEHGGKYPERVVVFSRTRKR